MSIREYLQDRPVRRGTKRIMRNIARMIKEVDYLKEQSRGFMDKDSRDLQDKLPQVLALIELARFELLASTHPLRHLAVDEEDTRNRLVATTGIRCQKCSQ